MHLRVYHVTVAVSKATDLPANFHERLMAAVAEICGTPLGKRGIRCQNTTGPGPRWEVLLRETRDGSPISSPLCGC